VEVRISASAWLDPFHRSLALVVLLVACGCGRSGPPYSPADALRTFTVEPGFRIESFVSEPDIRSPVAMEFDENGRIYVVEAPGYPLKMEARLGRVILLEDTDGDGRPDRRTVFADKLTMPTGVMRWKKGVIVTDAPDVLYFEDTDGDGRADVRKVVLTGFAFSNPQHTVNNPLYGLDNWIYLAHEGPATAVIFPELFGDRGGDLRFPDRRDGPSLAPARRMVRFRPDTGQLEYLSTSSQFGHSFDAWGHHFTVSNEDHIRQEVIRAAYLTRNPDLPVGSAMERISDHRPAADVYPITHGARVEMLSGVGSFTSACAITVYLGGAFSSLGLFSLVAEPAQNLVHRDVLTPAGATYLARRAREGVEFLASTDAWFRPVNFSIGPDGAIYLVDFYRQIVEHPEWMSTHTHKSPSLYAGEDRGRIYRISPDTTLPRPGTIRLGQSSDNELVQALGSPNIWWRRTAQRLLVDRGSAGAVEPLSTLFANSRSPVARLHALWTLEGLHKLETSLIAKALEDPEAGVRENAILFAEPRLSGNPALVERLLKMERDPDRRVQFQLLCTLGGIDSRASREVQDRLLAQAIDDPWMQTAALSASSERAPQLFRTAILFADKQTGARATFFRQVSTVIGVRRKTAEIRQVLTTLLSLPGGFAPPDPPTHSLAGTPKAPRRSRGSLAPLVSPAPPADSSWWRAAALDGLAQGLGSSQSRRGRPDDPRAQVDLGQDLLLKLFESADADVRRASLRGLTATGLPPAAAPLLARAAATAHDVSRDPALRADSIGLLVLDDPAAHEALFKQLIDPQQPEAVQAASVRGLARVKGAAVATYLIARWKSMTPAVRMEAADGMFLDPERPRLFLEAIEKEIVQPWSLAFRHKRQLLMSRDASLREAARSLLEEKAADREQVLKRYQAALERTGDPQKGRLVFERVCARCHRLDGLGHDVGPDLVTIRNRPPQSILSDIIRPSASIAQNYESYVVDTRSGGMIEGVMSAQTPTTITIRHEAGREDVIRRADITSLRVTSLSAMPADLDRQITIEQMADLLRFLRTSAAK
jgi:putative membrane-bound dehydrogenase-like protein